MSRITEFAVIRRSVVILLALALLGTGVYSWTNLQQELLPDIAFPVITVIAPYPGAGAADVTDQVTKPIERAIAGVPRLEQMHSTSSNSFSVVVAQFSFGTDVKAVRTAIESNIASVGLPAGVTPTVNALDINQSPVIIASIAAQGDQGLADAGRIARTDVVPALLGLDGVGSVEVTGGLEQRVVVTLDSAKLAADGISLSQVNGVLAANNLTLPSGTVTGGGASGATRIPVSTTGTLSSTDAIAALVVGVKGGVSAGATGGPSAGAGQAGGAQAGGAQAGGSPPVPGSASTGDASTATGGTQGPLVPTQGTPTPVTVADLGTVQLASVPTTG